MQQKHCRLSPSQMENQRQNAMKSMPTDENRFRSYGLNSRFRTNPYIPLRTTELQSFQISQEREGNAVRSSVGQNYSRDLQDPNYQMKNHYDLQTQGEMEALLHPISLFADAGEVTHLKQILQQKDQQISNLMATISIIEGEKKLMQERWGREFSSKKQLQSAHKEEIQKIRQQYSKELQAKQEELRQQHQSILQDSQVRQANLKQFLVMQAMGERLSFLDRNSKVSARLLTRYNPNPLLREQDLREINEMENLLLVISLVNGNVLAVFKYGQFRSKASSREEEVFICSLTNHRTFKQASYLSRQQDKSSTIADFSFGNGDLVIDDDRISSPSNFGTNSSSFYPYSDRQQHSSKYHGHVLLGKGKIQIETYEIYQLHRN